MIQGSKRYEEYSDKIQLLRLKVMDDIANAEFFKNISELDSHHIIKASELNIEKISEEQIATYESTYRIRIPDFIRFIMTEVGQSNLVCFWFFSNKKIEKPIFCFSYDFFHACLKGGISSDYLNDFDFDKMYENDSNTFKDDEVQNVFRSLNCDDEKYIIKLLPTGHGDCSGYECVVLNELNNGLVVYTVGWNEKVHIIDGVTYSQYDYLSLNIQIADHCLAFLQNRLNTTNTIKDLKSKQKINWGFLTKIFKS